MGFWRRVYEGSCLHRQVGRDALDPNFPFRSLIPIWGKFLGARLPHSSSGPATSLSSFESKELFSQLASGCPSPSLSFPVCKTGASTSHPLGWLTSK